MQKTIHFTRLDGEQDKAIIGTYKVVGGYAAMVRIGDIQKRVTATMRFETEALIEAEKLVGLYQDNVFS